MLLAICELSECLCRNCSWLSMCLRFSKSPFLFLEVEGKSGTNTLLLSSLIISLKTVIHFSNLFLLNCFLFWRVIGILTKYLLSCWCTTRSFLPPFYSELMEHSFRKLLHRARMVRGKFALTNQKQYPDLSSDTSSVWNFFRRSSDVISQANQWWHRKISSVFSG